MNTCRYCGARVTWRRTENNRRMPLNPDPDPHGNVVMRDGIAVVLTGTAELTAGTARYMPHAATCTAAPRGRGRRT